jgi:hypothetical protein
MNKLYFVICFAISLIGSLQGKSQTANINGKPVTEIFADYHYIPGDTSRTSGFALNRAFLGYNFLPAGNFSGTVILNVGSPTELSPGAKHRKYAFIREASISWLKDNLNISFGIVNTKSMGFQQKFLGKRYLADNFESINGYSIVADLGLSVDYKFNDIFKADFCLLNGEGYSELQLDNSLKASFGVTITPFEHAVVRVYGDINRPGQAWQQTYICFLGYKSESFTIGFDGAYKTNLDKTPGHNAWGFSTTCSKTIWKQTEIFVRYDYTTSVRNQDDILKWNYLADGVFAILGFQHSFNENVKVALDYQGTYPYSGEKQNTDAIFFNALFKF